MDDSDSKKVIVVSNFHEDNAISRTNIAYKFFTSKGFVTKVLYSDFSHSLKKKRVLDKEDFFLLKTIPYSESLSIKRILSHMLFAYRVFGFLQKNKCDIIYVNLPPNILAISVFFLLEKKCKTIVDIVDLWPESFPHSGGRFKTVAIMILGWALKKVRQFAIDRSNYCIAESNLFYKRLNLKDKLNSKVIHLKKFQTKSIAVDEPSSELSIAYLGNIGKIYDFDSLFEIIKGVGKVRKIHLHVIGTGPRSGWFFDQLDMINASYTYHGVSFDENLKMNVLSSCWFGFNGYQKNTEVSLSYKSIDYLSYGVPLINSAKEDTEILVNTKEIGFNFDNENINEIIESISNISRLEIMEMKSKAYNVFNDCFSGQSYFDEMNDVLKDLS